MKKGSTRYVFLTKQYAIKIPSFHSFRNFLWGLLANMQEVEFSEIKEIKWKLCPILFKIPLGFLIVMPRVQVLRDGELPKEYLESYCKQENYIIPAEIKYDSFGYFHGHLVVIDFG